MRAAHPPSGRGTRQALTLALCVAACARSGEQSDTMRAARPDTTPPVPPPAAAASSTASAGRGAGGKDTITTASGLRYVFLVHGTGPQPRAGQTVSVHYTGTLTSGSKFDSSRDSGQPFEFQLGRGQVIPGWDEGIALLRVGDRVLFTIPPGLGYGAPGMPPVIPPSATLIFDVELLAIR